MATPRFAEPPPPSLERDRSGRVAAYKLATIDIDLAILRGDSRAYIAAMAAREQLDVDTCFVPELYDWRSSFRCPCCDRLVLSGQCGDGLGGAL